LRKLAAILLGGIFLFNSVGYRILTGFLQYEADQRLEVRLDHLQYDESQLLSIKVPVSHLSYYNSSPVFERVDGQIEIEGIPYQYVKRRIYNDSLELLCIPNQTKLQLRHSGNEHVRLFTEQEGNDELYTFPPVFQIAGRSCIQVHPVCSISSSLPFTFLATDERPPAACC
jgi:hypothetical protein